MIAPFSHLHYLHKLTSLAVLLLLSVVLFGQQEASGAIKKSDSRLERVNSLRAAYAQALKTPMLDSGSSSGPVAAARPVRLGAVTSGPGSRGALVAQTWRDWAANANIGRTVAVAPVGNTYGTGVQFAYMRKASSNPADRTKWGWNGYDATYGAFVNPGGLAVVQSVAPGSVEAGAYPKILIYPENGKGITGSYDFPDQANDPDFMQMHLSFEAIAFSGNFGNIGGGSVMADTLNKSGNIAGNTNTIWPALGMTVSATDTVLYMFGFEAIGAGQPYGALKVFRHLSTARGNPDLLWQLVYIDTSFYPTQDFAASRVSTRVAAVWVNQTPAGKISGIKQDNDVYYAESPNGLSGTWTKHNLTNYTGAGYRAWLECNSLFDSADKLHIIWNGAVTDGVTFLADRSCQLFHWSEVTPGTFSIIYRALYSAYDLPCIGGANVMNVGSFSIGECDGRLYTVFSAWNDPQLEGVNDSDCATDASWLYGGNAELYVTTSKDLSGSSWDKPRNLSNSNSKGCDSTGNCADDRWASISEIGIDNNIQPGIWPPAATYDPSGTASVFTQIWYETDRYPGGAVLDPAHGPYTLNDMRWIRLACSIPQIEASLAITPAMIDFPAYCRPGIETDTTLLLENTGNTTLSFLSITVEEDSCKGPNCQSGWLGYTGISGSATIPEGGSAAMTLRLNQNGIITDSTTPKRLWGRIVFSYGPPVQTLSFPVSLTIATGVATTVFDTLATGANIKLVVGSNGNAGNNYAGHVNMNFNPPVECDTGGNSRGNADIYLGEASPVIVRKVGTGPATGSWSIFNQGIASPHGFKPLVDPSHPPTHTNGSVFQEFYSGRFTTVDSLLVLEKTWYAPTDYGDSGNFVIEKLRIWPRVSGSPVSNLAIGAAYDWDIPTDSGTSYNSGGYDAARRLVYQRGFNSLNTVIDCANNGMRYGGSALLALTDQTFIDGCTSTSDSLYGGYTARNDSFVYPTGDFVPEQLWTNMQPTGYYNQGGTSSWADLHTVLTFRNVQSITNGGWSFPPQARDTMTVYTAMAVVRSADGEAAGLDSLKAAISRARCWTVNRIRGCQSCCVGRRGNVNGTGVIDLSDLSAMVSYLTSGPFVPPCAASADLNGSGVIDLSDLACLVSYLTGGFCIPAQCPSC